MTDATKIARLRALAGRLEVQALVEINSGNGSRAELGYQIQDDASAIRWAIEQLENMEGAE